MSEKSVTNGGIVKVTVDTCKILFERREVMTDSVPGSAGHYLSTRSK